jgi:hypothetical protein
MATIFQRVAETFGGEVPDKGHNVATFGKQENGEPIFTVAYYLTGSLHIFTKEHNGSVEKPGHCVDFACGDLTKEGEKLFEYIEKVELPLSYADSDNAVRVLRMSVIPFIREFLLANFVVETRKSKSAFNTRHYHV